MKLQTNKKIKFFPAITFIFLVLLSFTTVEKWPVVRNRLADKAIEMIKSEGKDETEGYVPFAVEEYTSSDQSNNIQNYLVRVAGEITHNSLAGINSLDDWKKMRSKRYDELVEMLNCLRITDLPQVAGLLYPAKAKVIGQMPQSYNWAKTVYEKLDAGNLFEVSGEIVVN